MITPGHEVKVMDLGIATFADEILRLSETGGFVGSPKYASPEHLRREGEGIDGRADLFSLGVILYELACGENPHPGENFVAVLRSVLEMIRRLGELNPQLSSFFEELVHALLAKDREARFPSAKSLLEVLREAERSRWWGSRARALLAERRRSLRRIRVPRWRPRFTAGGRSFRSSTLSSPKQPPARDRWFCWRAKRELGRPA